MAQQTKKATTKKTKRSEDPYFNIGKLFEKFQEFCIKNETDHNVLRMEIQNAMTKAESLNEPEKFQKLYCPNTRVSDLTVKWIEKHEKWHEKQKEIAEVDRREKIKEERLQKYRNRTSFYTALTAIILFIAKELLTHIQIG